MRRFLQIVILALPVCGFSQTQTKIETGPEVGAVIPAFTAVDQSGKTRKLADLTGPKGLMLVFFRSADW